MRDRSAPRAPLQANKWDVGSIYPVGEGAFQSIASENESYCTKQLQINAHSRPYEHGWHSIFLLIWLLIQFWSFLYVDITGCTFVIFTVRLADVSWSL